MFFSYPVTHPVNLHFHREVGRIHVAYPRTAQLHVNEQVLCAEERVLPVGDQRVHAVVTGQSVAAKSIVRKKNCRINFD